MVPVMHVSSDWNHAILILDPALQLGASLLPWPKSSHPALFSKEYISLPFIMCRGNNTSTGLTILKIEIWRQRLFPVTLQTQMGSYSNSIRNHLLKVTCLGHGYHKRDTFATAILKSQPKTVRGAKPAQNTERQILQPPDSVRSYEAKNSSGRELRLSWCGRGRCRGGKEVKRWPTSGELFWASVCPSEKWGCSHLFYLTWGG